MGRDQGPEPIPAGPSRRRFLQAGLLGGLAGTSLSPEVQADSPPPETRVPAFELDEVGIGELRQGLKTGKYTARSLTEMYLGRIEAIDRRGPCLRSVIEVNPDALALAEALDREWRAKGPRGPLHGIPVLIKDNIDTADRMATTAGSLALVGARPPGDAFVARRLRQAGAVILGKTNLSEWANIRSSASTSGWSGRGGLTRNPYALDRNPSGSSSGSGVAVAASLCAVAVGTETDGSIVSPSSANGIVGIKPTVGLVSRTGIIPISRTQDTAGPMARSVRDAAVLLGILAGVDPADPATAGSRGKAQGDYTLFLDPKGLKGARLGVPRSLFGFHDAVDALMEEVLGVLRREGATLVDPVEIASLDLLDDSEAVVMLYELKADMNAYLARLGPGAPVRTLADVIAFNVKNRKKEMPYFGQDLLEAAEEKGPLTDKEYREALATMRRLARKEGIDAVMDEHRLDALIAPTAGAAWVTDLVNGDNSSGGSSTPAAVAGYPHITVPAAHLFGLPVGLSFFGRAWSEPTLIRLAYAFEQATKQRRRPGFLPTADLNA